MEITFLGTGTSHGIPVIGCSCTVCRSPDPRDKRLRTAIHVQAPEISFCVDTPPDFRQQCLREGINSLDAVVYTHAHSDHVLGFDDLRRFCEMEDKTIPVHASPATLATLSRVFSYAFDDSPKYRTYVRPEGRPFEGSFELGATRIVPVDLPHGRVTTNGLIFHRGGRKVLAYMTDCQAVPEPAMKAAQGAEVLVIDALRHAAHSTHLTVEQAADISRQIGAERTYFIHMCHDLGHEVTEASLPANIRLSYDGLRIKV